MPVTTGIPHKMPDAKIITLYRNEVYKADYSNYRGISLLSVVGKIFARVLLKHLQRLADRILLETQFGCRPGRSTADMVFTLRQLQEKYKEQRKRLFTTFVDLTKAFDTVSKKSHYMVLEKIGCPPILL